ncbi:hypothetical protein SAMN05877831_10411 [Rhodobacter maris]|uniref:Uncharacterized protein n=1 Tax=Rhodobacter maris TaxID=446682 RepID=A0A285SAV1_9RHOB|nr:hypothetical protein SAMN05877831_10411 [Rhodobacter maris]
MTRWLQAAKQAAPSNSEGINPDLKPVSSVVSVLSEGQPPVGPPPETFPYGSACDLGLSPRTWAGRVVSLADWRGLTDWERHGPHGKHWNGNTRQWEPSEGGAA